MPSWERLTAELVETVGCQGSVINWSFTELHWGSRKISKRNGKQKSKVI